MSHIKTGNQQFSKKITCKESSKFLTYSFSEISSSSNQSAFPLHLKSDVSEFDQGLIHLVKTAFDKKQVIKPLRVIVREITDLVEKEYIQRALKINYNNRVSTAKGLGISRQSLYAKMHRLKLNP